MRAAARSQLLVLDAVRAPRQGRLLRAALGLRGFREELEDRREALPGSELVTVGACGNTHQVTRGRTGVWPEARSPPSRRLYRRRRARLPLTRPGSACPLCPWGASPSPPPPPPFLARLELARQAPELPGAPGARGPQGQSSSSAGRATPSPAQKPPTSPGLGLVSPACGIPDSTTPTPERLGVLASQAEWGWGGNSSFSGLS